MALLADLDPAQREAVTTDAAPLRILAGAGSGKTRVLTRRIAYRIETGQAAPDRTVAVTFTRRAAGELRARLRTLGVEGVHAGTLHSFAWARLQRRLLDLDKPVPRIIDNSVRRLTDEEKRRRGVLDFEDVLVRFAEEIRTDRSFAEAVRWSWRHVYVDEFQDVTPAQFGAVMALVGDGTDLTVVGDPNQSIYGWNGADPDLLTSLPFATVRLDANYRSSPPIVRAAARVLGVDPPPTAGERGAAAPTVTGHGRAEDEARAIAGALRRAHAPGSAWNHIAVLARTNAYLEPIADALRARGIPVRLSRALLNRPAVRDSLARLDSRIPAVDAAAHLRSLAHDYPDPADADALHEVADMAAEFNALWPGGSATAFRAWLPTTRAGDNAGGDAVALATFHKAKGLEWPVVFVAGAHDGLVPSATGDRAEERRLLYVAMTRAERELHISFVGERSPFLPDDLAGAAESPAAPIDTRALFADLRRRLAEAS